MPVVESKQGEGASKPVHAVDNATFLSRLRSLFKRVPASSSAAPAAAAAAPAATAAAASAPLAAAKQPPQRPAKPAPSSRPSLLIDEEHSASGDRPLRSNSPAAAAFRELHPPLARDRSSSFAYGGGGGAAEGMMGAEDLYGVPVEGGNGGGGAGGGYEDAFALEEEYRAESLRAAEVGVSIALFSVLRLASRILVLVIQDFEIERQLHGHMIDVSGGSPGAHGQGRGQPLPRTERKVPGSS